MFGCLAFMIPASGQQPLQTLLVGIDRRAATSLNGDWHYLVDQSPARALYTGNGEINDKSYAMNTHPNIVGKHNEEYDFATAPTLKVPGDWNTQIPHLPPRWRGQLPFACLGQPEARLRPRGRLHAV